MGSLPLHYIDLRAFCYATEDDQRVESAIRYFLPDETPIERTETRGHHGDRIIVFSTRIENADELRYVLDRLIETDESSKILTELDQRVDDDCALFIKFDKQAAFQGKTSFGQGILFRAKIEAYPAKKAIAIENAQKIFSGN